MIRNSGVIYRQALIDNRRGVFWWGIGMGIFAFYMVVMYPMMGQFEELLDILESPVFQFMLGDIAQLDFATFEGFLGVYLFTFAPLVLAIFAVLFGSSIVGREEEKGTFDLLLSTPIQRWRVIVEKFMAFIIAALLILAIMLLLMVLAVIVTNVPDFDYSRVIMAGLNVLPILMLICTLTLFLTTILRSSGQAGSIAAIIVAASYFINSFAEMVDSGILKALHVLSFYKYYSPSAVLTGNMQWGNLAVLVGLTGILLGLSIYFFERRDITI